MENSGIAQVLSDLANLLDIKGENPFRIRSYLNAVRTIGDLTVSLDQMVRRGEDLTTLAGIGDSIAQKIAEIVDTGTCKGLEDLKKEFKPSLLDLLRLEGMGPKKVKLVYDKLGVDSVEALEAVAKAGKLKDLPGMGAKSEQNILKAIEHFRSGVGRFMLSVGVEAGASVLQHLRGAAGIQKLEIAGSLRRRKETVGDLDILAVCKDKAQVMDRFVAFPEVTEILVRGETKSSVRLRSGLQVDCRVVSEESFGAALHYFTGSQSHNIAIRGRANDRGLTINEYGVTEVKTGQRVGGTGEEEIFKAVGLPWIPPELRENRGEIEAAQAGKLPRLVEPEDLRGDLQMHTTASDGSNSILEMAARCKELGYEYLAITDHSKAVRIANGLDEKRLAKHLKEIEKADSQIKGIRILKSVEVDILADGSLDLDDGILSECDVVVASVHYRTNMEAEEMTARILKALENPNVCILAHPTGRLILEREPFSFDHERVFKAAKDAGVFLEVNAHPSRLDLKDLHCRQAKEIGAQFVISTDAHSLSNLDLMPYGVWTARRGWLEKKDVMNTLGLREFLKALRKKKDRL